VAGESSGFFQRLRHGLGRTSDNLVQGFFQRLRHGLGRTSDNLVQGLGTLFLGRKEIDAELLEELESRLLLADVGVDATMEII
jgi:signal recognition particle GTPase